MSAPPPHADSAHPTPPAPRATLSPDYQRDWPSYFDAVMDQPPRDTLLRALDAFDRDEFDRNAPCERLMIDLACGEGRDTRAALARRSTRWRVVAIDSSDDGLARLARSLTPEDAPRVHPLRLAMEEVPSTTDPGATAILPGPGGADLVNASFALPFCDPARFPALWDWILSRLAPGGRFAGQFFGDRDEWARVRPASHVDRDRLQRLLAPFVVEHLDEVEKDGSDAMGGVKHHHVFHVVARTP